MILICCVDQDTGTEYQPQDLERLSDTDWVFTPVVAVPSIALRGGGLQPFSHRCRRGDVLSLITALIAGNRLLPAMERKALHHRSGAWDQPFEYSIIAAVAGTVTISWSLRHKARLTTISTRRKFPTAASRSPWVCPSALSGLASAPRSPTATSPPISPRFRRCTRILSPEGEFLARPSIMRDQATRLPTSP